MKFNAWSKARIRNGTKTLTSRKLRRHSDPAVFCSFGPFPWWFIKRFLYRDEGAESPEELQRVINRIFRRTVEDHELFYVHVLNPDLEV